MNRHSIGDLILKKYITQEKMHLGEIINITDNNNYVITWHMENESTYNAIYSFGEVNVFKRNLKEYMERLNE